MKTLALTVALWLVMTSSAIAAVQGTTGPDSSAQLDIAVTTGLLARIDGLADMPLGTWSGTGSLTADDDICIGRNGVGFFAAGLYRIRASGDGDPVDINAFTLSNGTHYLHYDVFFNDQGGLAGRVPLTGGVSLGGQTSLGFFQIINMIFGCAIPNANVSIEIPASELQSVPGGIYAGTLTLMLIPE